MSPNGMVHLVLKVVALYLKMRLDSGIRVLIFDAFRGLLVNYQSAPKKYITCSQGLLNSLEERMGPQLLQMTYWSHIPNLVVFCLAVGFQPFASL